MTRGEALGVDLVRVIARAPRRAAAALALTFVVVGLLWLRANGWDPARGMPLDNSLEVWFIDGDPDVQAFHAHQVTFDVGEPVVVAVHAEDTLLRPDALAFVAELSSDLSRVARVKRVAGLGTALAIEDRGADGLVIERLLRPPLDVERVRTGLKDDPLLRDLTSPDGRTTLLTVQLERIPDIDARRPEILRELRAVIEAAFAEAPPRLEWRWCGPGIVHHESNELTRRESDRLTGLSLLALVVVLAGYFRRWQPVLVALLAVVTATTLLVGAVLATGHRLNLVTLVLPTLVLVIGVTDSVYFLSGYRAARDGLEALGLARDEVVARAIGPFVAPGLFNSITTSIGFLGFLATKMAVLRQLGVFAGLGIAIAFASSVLLCTLGALWLDLGRAPAGTRSGSARLGRLALACARRPRAVLLAAGALSAVALFGVTRLEVDTHVIRYFRPDHPVRAANDAIEGWVGPYLPLETVVRAPGGVLDPAVLRGVERLVAASVARTPELAPSPTYATVLARLHHAFLAPPGFAGPIDGAPTFRVPDEPDAIAQLALVYGPDRNDDPLAPHTDPARRELRVGLRAPVRSSQVTASLLVVVTDEARRALPAGAELRPCGFAMLYARLNAYLTAGQRDSLLLTFVLVFVVVGLLFRSARVGLVAIPANALPALLVPGVMGWLGIPLDPTTAMVGTITLGVATDDTVHVLFKLRARHQETRDLERAVLETWSVTGPAITATTLALSAGMLVLCLAEVRTLVSFGLLLSTALVGALLADLVLTPALCGLLLRAPPAASRGAIGDDPQPCEPPPSA